MNMYIEACMSRNQKLGWPQKQDQKEKKKTSFLGDHGCSPTPAAKKYGSAVARKVRSGWSRWTLHPEALEQAREADGNDQSDPAVQD